MSRVRCFKCEGLPKRNLARHSRCVCDLTTTANLKRVKWNSFDNFDAPDLNVYLFTVRFRRSKRVHDDIWMLLHHASMSICVWNYRGPFGFFPF